MPDGKILPMTRSFHPATDFMKQKFEIEFKYTVEYGGLSDHSGYKFALNIMGANYGVY